MFFNMKKIIFLLLILLFLNSCAKQEVALKVKDDVITILYPIDKQYVSDEIIVSGLSKNLEYIELQTDLGGWNKVNLIDEWHYNLDTKELENGDHVIYVRGFDGTNFTKVKAVRVVVRN